MVTYFNKGGFLMWPLLGLFIIGLIIAIVKLWLLLRARINSKKFLAKVLDTIKNKGIDEAIKLCEKTRGPVAALFHAALLKVDKGLEYVDTAVENEAAVQMGILEKGMIWLSTIVAIAPMLGFLGTVQGMIVAFDQIARSNDIVPSEVAGGISVALLTTFAGLAIAIPMQFFYNLFVAMIDGMIVDMEDATNKLIENLIDMGILKKAEK
ncbi:MAG TPA: MotA/TolQ/ExbB proton channel family protein [candidate division Zixibacteria bacterium]|nr:MotA/TolQ/ExbB proton channel family protein [candidate division Zixibacteria bacterium]